MAKKADKKIVASNVEFFRMHKQALLIVWAIWFGLNYVVGFSNVSIMDINFFIVTVGIEVGVAYFLTNAAKPTYGQNNEIVYPGTNMNAEGLVEYMRDILYVVMGAQLLSIVSGWAWYLLMVVPMFGVYIAWTTIIRPLMFR
eukprot:CFRG6647T1